MKGGDIMIRIITTVSLIAVAAVLTTGCASKPAPAPAPETAHQLPPK